MFEKEKYEDGTIFKRKGKFLVDEKLLREQPYAFQLVMAEIIVTECTFNWANKSFEYWAISPHFAEIPDNMEAPRYRPLVDVITKDDDPDFIEYKIQFDRM